MSFEQYNRARGSQPEASSPDTPPKRVEFIDVTEKMRRYGDQPLVILTSTFLQAKDNLGKFDNYAMVLRRCVDHEDKEIETTLEIQSPIIQSALKLALSDYGYLNLESRPIKIKKPYDALFHYRHELRAYANNEARTDEEKQHMEVLTKFMHTNLAASEREFDQLAPNHMITFPLLWALFRAEDIIIERADLYQQAYRVISCQAKEINQRKFFQIEYWSWDFNGTKYGPCLGKIEIDEFPGARKITELDVYPFRMISKERQDQLRSQFVERGHKWKSLVNISNGEYDGKSRP
jgi:hypothetical protein